MPTSRPVTRRMVVRIGLGGLGAVSLGLGGCSFDSLDPSDDDPTITPTAQPSGSTSGPASGEDSVDEGALGDAALVAEVLPSIALALRTARTNARVHPGLADVLQPLVSLHRAHGAELGTLPSASGRVADPGESEEQARARVDATEQGLQRQLVAAAGAAASGPLALTLASMAAGVAQLRTTL